MILFFLISSQGTVSAQEYVQFLANEICHCLEAKSKEPWPDTLQDIEFCFLEVIEENQEAFIAVYGKEFFSNEDESKKFGLEIVKFLAKSCNIFIDQYLDEQQQAENRLIQLKEEAEEAAQIKDFAKALILYNQAVSLDPEDPDLYNSRGLVYFNLERYHRAIADFYWASELAPDNHVFHFNLSFSKYKLQDYELALEDLEKSISLNDKFADSQNLMGLIMISLNKKEEAKSFFLNAYALDGTDADFSYNLGYLYFEDNRFAEALDWFKKSEAINALNIQLLSRMGNAYSQLEDFDNAVLYHRKCIDLSPEDTYSYFNLGLAFLNGGNPKLAIDQFNFAYEREKEDADITYYLAMCFEQLEDYKAALEHLAVSLEINPRNASYYDKRAALYDVLGQYEKAIEDYMVSISIYPNDCQIHQELGRLFNQIGNEEKAVYQFQKAKEKGCGN